MAGESQLKIVSTDSTGTSRISSRLTNPERTLLTLQDRITQHVYRPGEWLPTERELAVELNVNRSIIRDALVRLEVNGLIERRPGCRPRVVGAAPRPDLHPHVKSSAHVVAIVTPQHELDYASREIVRGIFSVLHTEEIPLRQMMFDAVVLPHKAHEVELEACKAIANGEATAAIVWPTLHPVAMNQWRMLRDLGHPVVFVDRCDETMSSDYVGIDNYSAAREAVEYLIELGHTRIAHLTTSECASTVVERGNGYRDAMAAAHLKKYQDTWIVPQDRDVETAPVIQRAIEGGGLPTAIFAVNDFSAYRCIEYLMTQDVNVPDQVSVVGFDDIDRYSPRAGFLTSIRQPFERIGQRAAALLLKRLSVSTLASRPYEYHLMPTRLIERDSCRSILYQHKLRSA